MTNTKEKLLSEVLKLSPIDKAQIIEDILSSFEFKDRKYIDKLWAEEAEDRIDAYEKGKIKTTSFKEVFKNISKK